VAWNIDTSRIAMLRWRRPEATPNRTVEPEARRQFCRQHAGGEHDHHGGPQKTRPSWIGVKCSPPISTRGAVETSRTIRP